MAETEAVRLRQELALLLRTCYFFPEARQKYDVAASLLRSPNPSRIARAERHRRRVNRLLYVLRERIVRCRQRVNALIARSDAHEPWRSEVHRRLAPVLHDLTDAADRPFELHRVGVGPTHREILASLEEHTDTIRQVGRLVDDVAKAEVIAKKRDGTKPEWNKDIGELSIDGVLVKKFSQPAANQRRVLDAFQEAGWPRQMDDPLLFVHDVDPKRRLSETVRSLNNNRKNNDLHFECDGTGEGVIWSIPN